jgi:hypothetical protein
MYRMTSILFEDVISNYAHSTTLFCLYEKEKKRLMVRRVGYGNDSDDTRDRQTDKQTYGLTDRQTRQKEKCDKEVKRNKGFK